MGQGYKAVVKGFSLATLDYSVTLVLCKGMFYFLMLTTSAFSFTVFISVFHFLMVDKQWFFFCSVLRSLGMPYIIFWFHVIPFIYCILKTMMFKSIWHVSWGGGNFWVLGNCYSICLGRGVFHMIHHTCESKSTKTVVVAFSYKLCMQVLYSRLL